MSEKKIQSNQRRKLLKSAALGGSALGAAQAMPEKWLKPVVDSVVLPAHAQTTDESGNLPVEIPLDKYYLQDDDLVNGGCQESTKQEPSLLDELGEVLVPAAHALDLSNRVDRYYLEDMGGGVYKFVYLQTSGESGVTSKRYTTGLFVVGSRQDLNSYNCDGKASDIDVKLVSVTPGDNAVIRMWGCGEHTLPLNNAAAEPSNVACVETG